MLLGCCIGIFFVHQSEGLWEETVLVFGCFALWRQQEGRSMYVLYVAYKKYKKYSINCVYWILFTDIYSYITIY